jgi:hypothetical protein
MRICQIFIIVININGELVYGFESGASSDQDEVIYRSGGNSSHFFILVNVPFCRWMKRAGMIRCALLNLKRAVMN